MVLLIGLGAGSVFGGGVCDGSSMDCSQQAVADSRQTEADTRHECPVGLCPLLGATAGAAAAAIPVGKGLGTRIGLGVGVTCDAMCRIVRGDPNPFHGILSGSPVQLESYHGLTESVPGSIVWSPSETEAGFVRPSKVPPPEYDGGLSTLVDVMEEVNARLSE